MAQDLTGLKVQNTYKDLLKVSNANSGITATATVVSDGEGTESVLKLSTTNVTINDIIYPTTDGTVGQVIQTDGAGNLSFVDQSGGSVALDDITDVTITLASSGDYLRYSGSAWVDVTVSQLETDINHDNLTGFVANEHIDWTSTTSNLSTSGTAATGALTVTGNIGVTGTVDGRDVATDGTKLDGIEALADVTDETNVTDALDGATLTAATVATGDKVLIQDIDAADVLKTATAQSIADLANQDHGTLTGLTDDDHTQYSLISSQAGAPASTPSRVGEVNVDTTGDRYYISTDTASSADWDIAVTPSSTDTFTNKSGNISQWTNDSGYITATLTDEEVQDKVGAMFSGNTETLITATYQDADGTIDLVVDEASIDHGSITGLGDDDHTQYTLISSGAGAPASTPTRVGEIYIDTTGDNAYISTDTASSADWDQATGGGSGLNNVVEDVTPQLGGDLDCNTFDIAFDDNTGINDSNGNEVVRYRIGSAVATAYFEMWNGVNNDEIALLAVGATNVNVRISALGTGEIDLIAPQLFVQGASNTQSSIYLYEGSAAQADNAGSGQIWVKSDTPNNLYFTDDAGTDYLLSDADILKADTADVLTAGFAHTDFSAGTKSSGTFTPDEANGNFQTATNGGAHTLAPPSNSCNILVQYTNNASAGAITTTGFTKVTGDSLTTTDGDDFLCYITKISTFSHLNVVALQ